MAALQAVRSNLSKEHYKKAEDALAADGASPDPATDPAGSGTGDAATGAADGTARNAGTVDSQGAGGKTDKSTDDAEPGPQPNGSDATTTERPM